MELHDVLLKRGDGARTPLLFDCMDYFDESAIALYPPQVIRKNRFLGLDAKKTHI
jgi:hypothetical protein|tara:strand:+ start:371 stop:535 length:165 start_codon:yes stop_codon:yes gene_type:complete